MSILREIPDMPSAPAVRQSTSGRLAVDVLGGLSLSIARAPIVLNNRKARALLAYLALEDSPSVSRERLAGLMWGDSDDHRARSSLRQTLMQMRVALEARGCIAFRTGHDDVSLAHEEVEVDLESALKAIANGAVPEALRSQSGGTDLLLAGYEDLSPMFRDWVIGIRRSAHDRLVRALEDGYEDRTRPRLQRRRLAETSFQLDPMNEAACRVVMQLAAEDGEIGVALKAYATLYEMLGADLDMEPSQPTQELVAAIKQGRFEAAPNLLLAHPVAEAVTRTQHRLQQGGAPVVAVLPLHSLGPEALPPYVAEGIVEDIVRVLSGLREPIVISNNSTRGFRGPGIDLPQVGESLGAQYLVSGSVRKARGHARISVELAEAATGAVLWSNVYDADDTMLFETQERIAAGIANALVPQVNAAELRRSRGYRREDLGAYHLLLHARDLVFRLDRPAFQEAGVLLRKALDQDPGFPAVHAMLADWYSLKVFQGWSTDAAADVSAIEESARTAIRLDPAHARALALLGHNRTITGRRYKDARDLFERALIAAPNDAEAWMWSSPTFAYIGETGEAIERAERAISLSPYDPFLFRYEHFLCIAHYAADHFEEAIHWGQRSLNGNPNYTSNLRITTAAMGALGRLDDARPLVRTIMDLQPGFSVSAMIKSHAFQDDARREQYGHHLLRAGLPR